MTLAPQDRYRRLDVLGRGGMGEVFLADDVVLRRKVAIKVVHKTALANPRAEKLLRREAKAAAALDNPFICKVYEVGESNGRVFIAMEYIQGETLRQRMQRGPMPMRDIISIAREIADGLEEASRQRVIHRDLKPSNIILTPQGHVKIMDFGLAKRLPGEESVEESTGTPEGMVVGTREYMSPEQLRGKPLEPNSDLFALGLILYELLSGQHPFKKSSALDTQFAILNETPADLAERCPQAPDALCDLVERLLHKSPMDRPRIGELRERLSGIADSARPDAMANPIAFQPGAARDRTLSTSASVEAFVARKPRVVLALGVALLLITLALTLWVALRPEATMPRARMSTLVTWPSNEEQAVLSPDAKSVSFISNRDGVKDLWVMDLAGGEPRRLTNAPGNLTAQTFSEDGSEIAYMIESDQQKLLQTIRIDGGPPTRSLSLPGATRIRRCVRWVGDHLFVSTQSTALLKISLSTGMISPVETVPIETARPSGFDVSRDGLSVAFAANDANTSRSISRQTLGKPARVLTNAGSQDASPFFSDAAGSGRLFFESNRSGQEDLWMIERPGREPRQITFGSNREFIESVSVDGTTIVFSEVLEGASLFSFDPHTGQRTQLTAENKRDISPSITQDGFLAFSRVSLGSRLPLLQSSILVGSVKEGRLENTRVALRDGAHPVLSPNGKWLAYLTQVGNPTTPRLNVLNVESGHTREIAETPGSTRTFFDFPWSFPRQDIRWSSDNILYFLQGPKAEGSSIMSLDPETQSLGQSVLRLPTNDLAAFLTPGAQGQLFYVHTKAGDGGDAVMEHNGGLEIRRFAGDASEMVILGNDGKDIVVAEHPRAAEDHFIIHAISGKSVRRLFEIEARYGSLRLHPTTRTLSFSRRNARDVENLYVKRLDTLQETPVTTNGIQGVAFSPAASTSTGVLVFSQQLRNKDLGIIRLDKQ